MISQGFAVRSLGHVAYNRCQPSMHAHHEMTEARITAGVHAELRLEEEFASTLDVDGPYPVNGRRVHTRGKHWLVAFNKDPCRR